MVNQCGIARNVFLKDGENSLLKKLGHFFSTSAYA
jgi:hypothetical protein